MQANNQNRQLIAYCRLSAETQIGSDDNAYYQLSRQIDTCLNYAKENELGNIKCAVVSIGKHGLTADSIDDVIATNPALSAVIRAAEAGEIDGIVCPSRDRITRSETFLNRLLEYLERYGVSVYVTTAAPNLTKVLTRTLAVLHSGSMPRSTHGAARKIRT
ncbi:MAG TPA: recombinase family protein [Armatimonadota bacterium]|jgi:DNA invertase Pin-like site-specific DNA recombinase